MRVSARAAEFFGPPAAPDLLLPAPFRPSSSFGQYLLGQHLQVPGIHAGPRPRVKLALDKPVVTLALAQTADFVATERLEPLLAINRRRWIRPVPRRAPR